MILQQRIDVLLDTLYGHSNMHRINLGTDDFINAMVLSKKCFNMQMNILKLVSELNYIDVFEPNNFIAFLRSRCSPFINIICNDNNDIETLQTHIKSVEKIVSSYSNDFEDEQIKSIVVWLVLEKEYQLLALKGIQQ